VLRGPKLSLYLLAANRRFSGEAPDLPVPEAPAVPVIWVHVGRTTSPDAARALILRLQRADRPLPVACTSDMPFDLPPGVLRWTLPQETRQEIDRFLPARIAACLWLGEPVRAALLHALHVRGVPTLGADLSVPRVGAFRIGPLDVARLFATVFARTDRDGEQLRAAGAPLVAATGPLREGPPPPPCDAEELNALLKTKAGRPAWLAHMVTPAEIEPVLDAHLRASHLSHRLALVLRPTSDVDFAELSQQVRDRGLSAAARSDDALLTEAVDVLIADAPGEDGLWYRVAPITFLGGSLLAPGSGTDPGGAAALGSAILHGPFVAERGDLYARLAEAGAAREVADARGLADAVADLQAPARAARMAEAGWRFWSEGAELTNRIADALTEMMDATQ
jgi:3-deoxy-D-manno-octulosonic-acid transferase